MAGHMKRAGVGRARTLSQSNNPDGRPQEFVQTGVTYQLAEWLNANLDRCLDNAGLTKREASEQLGYANQNIFSMWRTGKARVPLDRIPQIADLTGADISFLLKLWLEQYIGERDRRDPTKVLTIPGMDRVMDAMDKVCAPSEYVLLTEIRKAKGNPSELEISDEQIEAMVAIAAKEELHA